MSATSHGASEECAAGEDDERDGHERRDGRDDPPRPARSPGAQLACDHRHERGGDRAGRHQLEDQVRDAEGREERLQLRPIAGRADDDHDPDVAQHPRDEVRDRDDEPGASQGHAAPGPAGSFGFCFGAGRGIGG